MLIACSDAVGPLPANLITDAAHYVAVPVGPSGPMQQYRFTLIARFTNMSRHTIHLSRCFPDTPYPVYFVQPVHRDTVAAYDPGWACVGTSGFRVAPGATRVDTLPIQGPAAVDGHTGTVFGVFEGQFVIKYEMYACADETPACTKPVTGLARSSVFTVTRAN